MIDTSCKLILVFYVVLMKGADYGNEDDAKYIYNNKAM